MRLVNRQWRSPRWAPLLGVTLLSAVFAACAPDAVPTGPSTPLTAPTGQWFTDGPGHVAVCKLVPEPSSDIFHFSFSATGGQLTVPAWDLHAQTWPLDGSLCAIIWTSTGDTPVPVTITESPKAGWELFGVAELDVGLLPYANNSVTVEGKPGVNAVIVFVNRKIVNLGGEGCTPGYWKNNADKKGASAWGPTGVAPGNSLASVGFNGFTVASGNATSFVAALNQNGGGENALMRHAAAAYLSAAHPNIDYDWTTGQIVSAVNAALASGNATTIEELKTQLDVFNNYGCTLDQFGRVK